MQKKLLEQMTSSGNKFNAYRIQQNQFALSSNFEEGD